MSNIGETKNVQVKHEAEVGDRQQPSSGPGPAPVRDEQPESREELIQERGNIVREFSKKM